MITRRIHSVDTYSETGQPNEVMRHVQYLLDNKLAPAERIVSVNSVGRYWFVITESFGLGPKG